MADQQQRGLSDNTIRYAPVEIEAGSDVDMALYEAALKAAPLAFTLNIAKRQLALAADTPDEPFWPVAWRDPALPARP
jgi:hypothetical protein